LGSRGIRKNNIRARECAAEIALECLDIDTALEQMAGNVDKRDAASLEDISRDRICEDTTGFEECKQEYTAKFRLGGDRHLECSIPDTIAVLICVGKVPTQLQSQAVSFLFEERNAVLQYGDPTLHLRERARERVPLASQDDTSFDEFRDLPAGAFALLLHPRHIGANGRYADRQGLEQAVHLRFGGYGRAISGRLPPIRRPA
jgi:hypothetical protein